MMSLHNHTTYSDGKMMPREVIEAAIGFDLKYVAITDHFATLKVQSLEVDSLGQYIASMRDLADRYRDRIRVLVGVEIDASDERTNFNALPYERMVDLDFVLLEYVQDPLWHGIDLWEILPVRSKIACPVGLAHNDIGRNFKNTDTERLVGLLESHEIFVELCSSLRNSKFDKPYYRYAEDFFKVARGRVGISIGTDSHYEKDEVGDVADALEFIEKLGLENDLITKRYWP